MQLAADTAQWAEDIVISVIGADPSALVTAADGWATTVALTSKIYGSAGNYTLATTATNTTVNSLAAWVGYGVPNTLAVRGTHATAITTSWIWVEDETVTIWTEVYCLDIAANGCSAGTVVMTTTDGTTDLTTAQADISNALVYYINKYSDLVTATDNGTDVTLTAKAYGTAGNITPTETLTNGAVNALAGWLNHTDTSNSIANVSIYVNSEVTSRVSKAAFTSTDYVEFTDLDQLTNQIILDKDVDTVLTVKIDVAGIGNGAADTATNGNSIKLALEWSAFVDARGYSSNNDLDNGSMTVTSVESQLFTVYSSKMLASKPSEQPTGSISNWQEEVLKFTLTSSTNNSKTAQLVDFFANMNLTDDDGSAELGIIDNGSTYALEIYQGSTRVGYYSATTIDKVAWDKKFTITADDIATGGDTYVVKANLTWVESKDKIKLSIKVNAGAWNDGITWSADKDNSTVANVYASWIDLGANSSVTTIDNTKWQ